MNPDTNKFEQLYKEEDPTTQALAKKLNELESRLMRPNGEPVPTHWSVFQVDELYVINDYTFRCKYIGETSILFEPVSASELLK